MKKNTFSLILFIISTFIYSQNNTFPNSGNVGIGTTSPNAKLEVRVGGWGNIPRISFSQSSDHPSIRFYRPTGSGSSAYPWWIESGVDRLSFRSGSPTNIGSESVSDKVTFLTNGNVGIGTTTPSTRLAVQGDNQSISVSLGGYNYSTSIPIGAKLGTWNETSAAGIKFHRWLGSGSLFHTAYIGQAHHDGDYGLDFKTDNVNTLTDATTSRLFISSYTGNVGIGLTNPDEKLTVKGKIHTQEVRVDLNGVIAPDYVFEKDYNLNSLSEIETYINKNKHLPEIPSAKEMEKDGVYLKKMNLLLLKKIEELTLHLIEQNKRIEKLELENNKSCNEK